MSYLFMLQSARLTVGMRLTLCDSFNVCQIACQAIRKVCAEERCTERLEGVNSVDSTESLMLQWKTAGDWKTSNV